MIASDRGPVHIVYDGYRSISCKTSFKILSREFLAATAHQKMETRYMIRHHPITAAFVLSHSNGLLVSSFNFSFSMVA